MNNKNNKLNLIFSAVFFIAGGSLLLSPGIFPFLFTTATWMATYLVLFLCSVYLGVRYIKKATATNQNKLFIFCPLTITTSLAYFLVLVSSFFVVSTVIGFFNYF